MYGRHHVWHDLKNRSHQIAIDAYCRHLAEEEEMPWFVLDSAAYMAGNIANWGTAKRWMTRVPETIAEAKIALQSVATDKMTALDDGYAIHPTASQYGEVSQRWLVVYLARLFKIVIAIQS